MPRHLARRVFATLGTILWLPLLVAAAASIQGGPIPGPLPIFPRDNWWNIDISAAPIDPSSASYIAFIGGSRGLHPDFGGDVTPGSVQIYGFPYAVVDSTVTPRAVQFQYSDESDGVDHATNLSFPFYPIPDEAMTQPHWIEGGEPGNVDSRSNSDRHLIIVDRDRRYLYELYSVFFDGSQWRAGSGAFFDLNSNARRPDGWTSADAAGLAILPGLVRYDEVFGPGEIEHALRVTVRATNGYVYPASHRAGSTAGALPMGARLRLKSTRDLSSFTPEVQKIFRAMQRYGLIVADNGSDMYVSGTYDTRWNNSVLNPAFGALKASDFEVVQLGYRPSSTPRMSLDAPVNGAIVGPSFMAAGWAVDLAGAGTGVDAVHVWAYPNPGSGQAPVFVGANYGGTRSDVGAVFGANFTNSGFFLRAPGLSPGSYRIAAFAHSTVTASFNNVRTADVTIAGPLMALDVPSSGATRSGPFVVAGWALDLGAASGPGVDAIHVWAFPVDGRPPVFAGAGGVGTPRPDLVAFFGSQFANAGYSMWVTLPAGVYDLGVYAHSSITGTFNQFRVARITITP